MGLIKTQNIGLGDWLGKAVTTFYNRTGATVLRGQVVMCDILQTQGETTTFKVEGVETDVLANLTTVTQAACEAGQPLVVCIDDSVVDNAVGRFLIFGRVEVGICDDDVSTTDIDRGDPIAMLVSESAVYPQAFATGAAAIRCLGMALEDAAASSSDTDRKIDVNGHLRWCIWMGGIPCFGFTDT